MTDLIGQVLGRYKILEQLGVGGMAAVFKAYDTRLERDVAIKVLRTEQFPPAILERIQKRFEREAKALARLSHPNIVNVHDFGDYEGQPFLVMEYLPGGTLKDRLGKPMAWQEACRILLPIASALTYAHEHGILHRDVKPSNILFTDRGQPRLTDFGIAKILDLEGGETLTSTGVGIGTPEYMSPEQGLGNPVNAATDIYSLGVVLYEMITGRKPYTADTPMSVVVKHLNEPLPRPAGFIPSLPKAVEDTLLKSLAKNPQERFQGMGEFSAALEKLLLVESAPSTPDLVGAFRPPSVSQFSSLSTNDLGALDQGQSRVVVPQKSTPIISSPQRSPMVYQSQPPRKKKTAWLAWLAGAAVIFTLLCLLLVGIFLGDDIVAAVFPTDTPTPTFTPKNESPLIGDWIINYSWSCTDLYDVSPIEFFSDFSYNVNNDATLWGMWYLLDYSIDFSFNEYPYSHYIGTLSPSGDYMEGTMDNSEGNSGCWYANK